MAEKKVLVHLDLNKQQLLNAVLQVLATHPSSPAIGQIYWNSAQKKPFIWTGSEWLDMGQVYEHPSYTVSGNTEFLTNSVISKIIIENGHVVGVESKNITPATIGAAPSSHTHGYTDVTGLDPMTILANPSSSGGKKAASAITVEQLLQMMSIAYGDAVKLSEGTNTDQATWSAKQIADYVRSKTQSFITQVSLGVGTRKNNVLPVTISSGSGVDLPAATSSLAGVMLASDKAKLDGIAAGANNYVHPTNNPGSHPFATEVTSGVLVPSQLVVDSTGHVVAIKGRNLTANDLVPIVVDDAASTGGKAWSASKIQNFVSGKINEVNQAATGALIYKGTIPPDEITSLPILNDTNIKQGWTYVVNGNGVLMGEEVEIGDMIIALTNGPGAAKENWSFINKNIPAIVSATEAAEGIIKLASRAEAIAGTNTTKAITPFTLKAALDTYTGGYYATFGNGSSTSFTITHSLNSDRVMVQVREVSTKSEVILDWRATSASVVTLNMNVAPANNQYEVLITKI